MYRIKPMWPLCIMPLRFFCTVKCILGAINRAIDLNYFFQLIGHDTSFQYTSKCLGGQWTAPLIIESVTTFTLSMKIITLFVDPQRRDCECLIKDSTKFQLFMKTRFMIRIEKNSDLDIGTAGALLSAYQFEHTNYHHITDAQCIWFCAIFLAYIYRFFGIFK